MQRRNGKQYLQIKPSVSMAYVETSQSKIFSFKSKVGIFQVQHPFLRRALSELFPLLMCANFSEEYWRADRSKKGRYFLDLIDYLLENGVLQWSYQKSPYIRRKKIPVKGTRITYLGHTSILVESGFHSLLIDPMFYSLTPRHWRLSKERQGSVDLKDLPFNLCDLPAIDGVAISHVHADHCDPFTLFWFDKMIPIYIPKIKTALREPIRKLGFSRIYDLKNWEAQSLGPIRLTRIPSHVQMDTVGPTEQCTWLVSTPHVTAYFGTDIRFLPKVFFKVAKNYLLDVAFLPTSSHRHLGRDVTMGVDQALDTVAILKPQLTVPYACWDHWWLPKNTENFRGTRHNFIEKAEASGVRCCSGPAGTAYVFYKHRFIKIERAKSMKGSTGLHSIVEGATLK